jgi:hypothetical protein
VIYNTDRGKAGPYKYLGTELKMPDHDFDIRLIKPDGTSLLVQWRVEGETVDVCVCNGDGQAEIAAVYVYMNDLGPAIKRKHGGFLAQQVTIMK